MSRLLALLVALFLALVPLAPSAVAGERIECAACGGVIGPGRYLKDQWDVTYHEDHADLTICHYCARRITERGTGGGMRYADGREVCNVCVESAVTDPEQAAEILQQVRERLAGWGLAMNYGAIPVKLVDQTTLRRMYGRNSEGHGGSINGLTLKQAKKDRAGKLYNRTVAIYMLMGMPLEVYEQTAAHELMHAWMFLDNQPQHTSMLEEGTCNLAAYYLLQESDSRFAGFMREALFESKDPVYGGGLRRAIRYVQAHQFGGLVKLLRSSRDFPAGY